MGNKDPHHSKVQISHNGDKKNKLKKKWGKGLVDPIVYGKVSRVGKFEAPAESI